MKPQAFGPEDARHYRVATVTLTREKQGLPAIDGRVVNLSRDGIGLRTPCALQLDERVLLELNPSDAGIIQPQLHAVVRHVSPSGDGRFHIGCLFTSRQLTATEYRNMAGPQ